MARSAEWILTKHMRGVFDVLNEIHRDPTSEFIQERALLSDAHAQVRSGDAGIQQLFRDWSEWICLKKMYKDYIRLSKAALPDAYWEALGIGRPPRGNRAFEQIPLGGDFAAIAHLETTVRDVRRLSALRLKLSNDVLEVKKRLDAIVDLAERKGLPDTATVREVVGL